MEQTYASRLRYIDAADLDDSTVDFDGLDVRAADGNSLGSLDGFLVDPASGRVLHTVVDSGGWFRSRRFLVPIGHANLDTNGRTLRVDVTRDRLRDYPEFDERSFRELSDDELRSYEGRMAAACGPDDRRGATGWNQNTEVHYKQPAWWTAGAYSADRLYPIESRPFRGRAAVAGPVGEIRARDTFDREHVTAHADEDRVRDAARERDDVSPHHGGRAQPGDVLGLETGGEITSIGDSAEDEDERRRAAERAQRGD